MSFLQNIILNLPAVKKKIATIETEHRNELNRMATKFSLEEYKQSSQYSLSDKEKIDRINLLEVKNKKLHAEIDLLEAGNDSLTQETEMLKQEKQNLFPSNRIKKIFALRRALTHEKEVTKNLKTEIASLKGAPRTW